MNQPAMQLMGPAEQPLLDEWLVLTENLPLNGARVLELGCGAAAKTRQLAEHSAVAHIVASEVDEIQHAKNQQITDLPKVAFKSYGAEQIDEPDASFDIVLMFKSLHHVPIDNMATAFAEMQRVLKPGGLLYISEPVFAGALNEVIRLFHDEQQVREAAFAATRQAIEHGRFALHQELFFKSAVRMRDFGQFEQGILNATHTEHRVDDDLLQQVRERFENNRCDDGYYFEVPHRVDLLRRA